VERLERVEMATPWLRVLEHAVELRIKVVPSSSRDRIAGVGGDRLRLRVTSPPVDGEANRAVLELLARSAGVPLRAATLVAGASGRSKTVRIDGESPQRIARKLPEMLGELR